MSAGVFSTSVFLSVTLPVNGQNNSLAALTLSRAPHSSIDSIRDKSLILMIKDEDERNEDSN